MEPGGNARAADHALVPDSSDPFSHNPLVVHPDPLVAELEPIVREAGRIAQKAREELVRELKPDGSVVTNGDRLVEEFLRRELPRLVLDAGIWGEEFGYETEGPGGLWTVDPVDGTTNYAFRSPIWGVTVGLVKGAEFAVGAVFLPDLGEMYLASLGHGATLNGQPMKPIPPGPVEPFQTVSYGETLMRRYPGVVWPGKMRCTGAFVVEAMFTATQRYRGMIGIREKLYDVAGSVCIARELDADVRNADGTPLNMAELKENRPIAGPWLIFPKGSGFTLQG